MHNNIINEMNRCYGCKNKPCMNKCPLSNDITGIISLMKDEKYIDAYELLTKTSVLPAVCSRVCPHMKQCMSSCTASFKGDSINIGLIESFLADMATKNGWKFSILSEKLKNKKFAVVGGGPSGLTAAAFLARNSASVTIFDKHEKMGGILRYGIPEFRLDKDVLDNAINQITDLGVVCKTNLELGKTLKFEDLKKDFDAVILAFGANISNHMNVPGENLSGVYGGNELLEYSNHPDYKGKHVFICGGGNVAMDSARTVKKLGAEKVTIIYRRSEEEMPAEKLEVYEAKKEGIEFLFYTNLIGIYGDKEVERINCVKTKYADGKLINDIGTEFYLSADFIIIAIGSSTDLRIIDKLGIKIDSKGYIIIDENYMTSEKNVFAIGDLAGEKSTVAWAARSGRNIVDVILRKF